MNLIVADLRITMFYRINIGETYVDPADESRHVLTTETRNKHPWDYLVIAEERNES